MSLPLTVARAGVLAVTPSSYSKAHTKYVPIDSVHSFTIRAGSERSTFIIHSHVSREDIAVFENVLNADVLIMKGLLLNALSLRHTDNEIINTILEKKLDERVERLEAAMDKLQVVNSAEVFDRSIYEMDERVGRLEQVIARYNAEIEAYQAKEEEHIVEEEGQGPPTEDEHEEVTEEQEEVAEEQEEFAEEQEAEEEEQKKDAPYIDDDNSTIAVTAMSCASLVMLAGYWFTLKYHSTCGPYCPF